MGSQNKDSIFHPELSRMYAEMKRVACREEALIMAVVEAGDALKTISEAKETPFGVVARAKRGIDRIGYLLGEGLDKTLEVTNDN